MEIAFVLLVAWVLITLVGHASWLLIRGFFRVIMGVTEPTARYTPPNERTDIQSARRVVARLVTRNLIDEPTAAELQAQLRNLEYQQSTSTIHPLAPSREPEASSTSAPESDSPGFWEARDVPVPEEPIDVPAPGEPIDVPAPGEPIMAMLVEDAPHSESPPSVVPAISPSVEPAISPNVPPHQPPQPPQPAEPVLSRSEVIQSFLAAHNIRWGELVAGMLIVICSIGLVISLWSPLVETHRVIPSLIFLGANAAIYAAGLYTLSRWRLRHTSRAVLIIATLLVPLSVLAGLAATGTSPEAVRLNDPITLGAIGLAGAVYSALLFLGGRALSRSWHAVSIAAAAAGPVAVLPLMPAAVRTFGSGAGWTILIGSGAILVASLRMIRFGRRPTAPLGAAGSRARLLMMAFGGFALAVSVGYAAFTVRDFGIAGMLPIAIATIPAAIALAGTSRSLMLSSLSNTMSMTGAVLCTILIGLTWVILPPSMTSASWAWSWAIVLAASAAVVGWFFHQSRWLAFATLPLGVAATFSAPMWIGNANWESIALWQRMIGGEPMLAASAMAIVVACAAWLIREPASRQWMGYAAIFWSVIAALIAAVLSIAPDAVLGAAPWWTVSVVLAGAVAVAVALSMRHTIWSLVTIGAVVFAWLSLLRPVEWRESIGSSSTWMMTFLGIATTMMVLREWLPRLAATGSMNPRVAFHSAGRWESAANVASVAAAVIACLSVGQDWKLSSATLVAASFLLFWASTTSKSIEVLRFSQVATAALAVVIGYGRFYQRLFGFQAWSDGTSIWAWAVTGALVAGIWMLVRGAVAREAGLVPARFRSRFAHLNSKRARPRRMIDGVLVLGSTALTCIGSAWAFAGLLSQASGVGIVTYNPQFLLPMVSLTLCAAVTWAMHRIEKLEAFTAHLGASLGAAIIVWSSSQVGHLIDASAITRLVVAASLAAAAGVGISLWTPSRLGVALSDAVKRVSMAVATSVIAVASSVLLWVGWVDPILANGFAEAFPSITVATWWIVGSAALLWNAKQSRERVPAITSAILFPAAVALIVPVFVLSHPAVWVQVAAIASLAWMVAARAWFGREDFASAGEAIHGSNLFGVLVGVISAVLVTVSILLNVQSLHPVFGPASVLISVLAVVLWCLPSRLIGQREEMLATVLPWPIGLSILAGQISWVAYVFGLVSGVHVLELVPGIWVIASVASLVADRVKPTSIHFFHIASVSVAVACVAWIVAPGSVFLPWLALVALVLGGLQVAFTSTAVPSGTVQLIGARLLGWFVVGAGAQILLTQIGTGMIAHQHWTMLVIWSALWVVAWRLMSPDTKTDAEHRSSVGIGIPDVEFAVLLMAAAILEALFFALSGRHTFQTTVLGDPMLWVRVAAYAAVSFSAIHRSGRTLAWTPSMATLVATIAIVAVHTSIHLDATSNQRFVWGMLSSGFAIAFVAHWLPAIARRLAQFTSDGAGLHLHRLVRSTWQIAVAVAGLGVLSSSVMIVSGAPAADSRLAIVAVALAAWAIAEMAEACDGARLRHAAVTVALVTIGLWASIDSGGTNHPILTASMRWLVASVFTIPLLLFVFPRLLGESLSARWRDAFHRGAIVAATAAGGSLIGMLVMEAWVRSDTGIDGISIPIVVFVALVLGALSVMAAAVAILSGPGSTWRDRFDLSDRDRVAMILTTQVIGGLTWLHVFLCKTDWAFVGLRGYWPFIVMALAFLSVGATEWARRRGDQLMSRTLAHTALYLPLIPVVGFWLSGSLGELNWVFQGGKVRYDVLLALGAIYYVGLSVMWKHTMPRVAAVVLGNAAWWVLLVQFPGWGFLSHPQAWLIPPAVCVLVVAHLYRERLEPAVASGIRYASTLVIYISSTADMLLQQIGTSISGPIVLVLLALAGMAAGVVLRVRPFLYLGATFVFLGVTSMVWHANRAFDAVWPWWVFGISTGICLLIGLMAIEKNKSKLRQYADSLATWQG